MEYLGLQIAFHQKASLQLDCTGDSFVMLKFLCNVSKIHRLQDRAEEIESRRKRSTHRRAREAAAAGRTGCC